MLGKCRSCKKEREVSIYSDLECCGVGGFCEIQSFSFNEFVSAYQELRQRSIFCNSKIKPLENAKFVIPINDSLSDSAKPIRNDLAAQILLNNTVCIEVSSLDFPELIREDKYIKKLVKNNLLTLVDCSISTPLLCKSKDTEQELSIFIERDYELKSLRHNFQDMIWKKYFEPLYFKEIVPSWATLQANTISWQGGDAIICQGDIVAIDNPNQWLDRFKKQYPNEKSEDCWYKNISFQQIRDINENDEFEFLFNIGIEFPDSITIQDLIQFREERVSIELREHFGKSKTLTPEKRSQYTTGLQKKLQKFNTVSQENFQTKTIFLSGLIATFGGLIGGTTGSFVSGIGSTMGVYYANR